MNYRHLFHAGNFADVFKHVALMQLLRAFHKKETPLCYVDTHAGAGRYDLVAAEAQKSHEYRDGIARLWDVATLPAPLAGYVEAVRRFNPDGRLRFYPGSPWIARWLLRPQDRMLLCEPQPEQCVRLKTEFARDAQVAVHERDGYEAMKALLPPTERRGLVLIDPPYEQPDEFARLIAGLDTASERWATGTYAVWYPVKDRAAIERFHTGVKAGAWRKVLVAEFMVFPEDTAFRLNGCGLLVVNPPWGFDDSMAQLLPALGGLLARGPAARGSVEWLVGE
jgi:23S rRNA (adenine2030-N6)-methyltransferase